MLVVHGVWLPAGSLAVWAEDSAAPAAPRRPGRPPRERPHPFAAPADALTEALGEPALKAAHGSATLQLPTAGGRPLDSPELVRAESPERVTGPVTLAAWRVPVLELDPDAALPLLAALDGVAAGASLRHLAEVAAFATDLVRRGRVLPTVEPSSAPAGPLALWRPLLTRADAAWARALAAALPPAGRAAGGTPAQTVAGALDALVDAAARMTGVRVAAGRGTATAAWLAALTGPERRFTAAPADVAALAADLAEWQRDAAGGAVRACFRLVEPSEEDTQDWRVDFALQAAE